MEPLRLDPADPLASVLAWLAALARALGLDLDPRDLLGPLSRPAAAIVRGWLADWRRQLRRLVFAEAIRLARALAARPRPPRSSPAPNELPLSPCGRGAGVRGGGAAAQPRLFPARSAGAPHPCCSPTRGEGSVDLRPSADDPLTADEEAALRRRTDAVIAALKDRSGLVRRLALRLVRRTAHARAARAALHGHSKVPHPPRTLGAGLRAVTRAPEPRPPDHAISAVA
jgi:hypothetical protein